MVCNYEDEPPLSDVPVWVCELKNLLPTEELVHDFCSLSFVRAQTFHGVLPRVKVQEGKVRSMLKSAHLSNDSNIYMVYGTICLYDSM